MESVEIERKFLVGEVPGPLSAYPCHTIEQAYLCTDPVVRVRRQDGTYSLTYKGRGLMAREEYNLALTKDAYEHLKQKADGNIIAKKRYVIPLPDGLKAELDVFLPPFAPLVLAEVEFPDMASADAFSPPAWFRQEVTYDKRYQNSFLSKVAF